MPSQAKQPDLPAQQPTQISAASVTKKAELLVVCAGPQPPQPLCAARVPDATAVQLL